MPRSRWWGPAHAYAIVLIAALSLMSVGTGRWVGAAGGEYRQFRQVMLATALPNTGGNLSPDGEKLAFISEGSLWVALLDRSAEAVRTRTPVRLTEPMGAWDDGGVAIAWSGNSKWIAFRATKPGTRGNPGQIYLISSSGGEPRLVAATENLLNFFCYRVALSPDGGKVYFADGERIRTRVYETSVGTNERRSLTAIDTMQPAISPDGAWIAYLGSESSTGQDRQLWTMPVGGGDPILVCEVPADGFLRSPVWSPDGSKIALLVKPPDSRLFECTEIWMVPMGQDGHSSGVPDKCPLRKKTNAPIAGWTQHNEIALLFEGPKNAGLYAIPSEGGQAVQITDHWSSYPNWSPDGRTIYYRGDGNDAYWGLFRVPAESGSRTELSFQGEALGIPIPGGGPSLSPDGTRLCFAGVRRSDVETGKGFPSALYVAGSTGGEPVRLTSEGRAPTWSPDGKKIAFTRGYEASGENIAELLAMTVTSGEPQRISKVEDQVEGSTAAWSPDGELIAYLGRDNTLRVIPAAGGPSRVLASNVGPVRGRGIAWSPDGQEIAFTAGDRIWKIARGGGEPKEIRIGLKGVPAQIDWSPDGKRLVFAFGKGGETELWLMSNLPNPGGVAPTPIRAR